jgi:catechol 2,3-dioxygenase-like lactoylglutathione lyase family enzyme
MNFLHIKETCIYIHDIDRTRDFYHGKLGLEVILSEAEKHIFFRAGSSVLLCFISSYTKTQESTPPHGASGNVHFAFEINGNEYAEAKNEVIQKGIIIEHEHEWKDKLQSFYFRDPDGNLVEIAQKGIWDKI